MRNRYPGTCYRCGTRVEAGEGHFERSGNSWKIQHAECAIAYRGSKLQGPRPDTKEAAVAVYMARSEAHYGAT
jgi:hypothetical protein